MGWINQGQLRQPRPKSPNTLNREGKAITCGKGEDDTSTSFIEDVAFPFCVKSIPNTELPFIAADIVAQHNGTPPLSRLCEFMQFSTFIIMFTGP
jgi:hypothetical protein